VNWLQVIGDGYVRLRCETGVGMAPNAYALHIALGVFELGQMRWRQA
jgi:hypothetical protein